MYAHVFSKILNEDLTMVKRIILLKLVVIHICIITDNFKK